MGPGGLLIRGLVTWFIASENKTESTFRARFGNFAVQCYDIELYSDKKRFCS